MRRLRPSGFGGMLQKMMLCRKKSLYPNMEQVVLGGGVRETLMHRGSVVRNPSMQSWTSLSLLHVLSREMDLGCCFGMKSGAGNSLLKFNFQIFLEWHAREMLQRTSYYPGIEACLSCI